MHILRSLKDLSSSLRFMRDPLQFMSNAAENAGSKRVVYLKIPLMGGGYLLLDPDDVNYVVKNPAIFIRPPEINVRAARVVGEGIALSEGDLWRKQRRELQPLFDRSGIANQLPFINAEINAVVGEWPINTPFDIVPALERLVMDVVSGFLLGEIRDGQIDPGYINETLRKLQSLLFLDFVFPNIQPTRFLPGFASRKKEFDRYLESLIISARNRTESNRENILQHLIKQGIGNDDLKTHLLNLLVAANETTAFTIGWLLHLLLINPGWLNFVQKQVIAMSDVLTFSELSFSTEKMLDLAILETMRLYPVAPLQARMCTSDCNFDGVKIEEGRLILISPYVLQRRTFEKGNEWDPVLHFGQNVNPPNMFALFKGPHTCIGRILAIAIIKSTVKNLLNNFSISLINKATPKTAANIRPNGLIVLLKNK